MSAACSHVRAPLSARKMTSCIFIARSTAAAAKTIGTSLGAYGCSPVRPQSGHFTCSRERTDHVLPTEDLPIFCVALGNLLCPEDLNLAATSPLANLRVAAPGQSDRRAPSLPSSFPRPVRDGSTSSPSGTE